MSLRLHICDPGWESALLYELQQEFPTSRHRVHALGWLSSELAAEDEQREASIAFARQCLPEAVTIAAPSVAKWAAVAGTALIEQLQSHEGPWRLHVFSVHSEQSEKIADTPSRGRCQLIENAIRELLKKKQRRLLRTLIGDSPLSQLVPWFVDEALVQVGLVTTGEGFISCVLPSKRQQLRRCVSRFAAGEVEIASNLAAPARAFAKLAEAELQWGRAIQPGETCVDLGASPGSWTWWAIERGALVTALDRSPLRDDLMRHPRVRFVKGDAFAFEPIDVFGSATASADHVLASATASPPTAMTAQVDWLLSDIIAFPSRIYELLETWLSRRWCRQFCVTIKFRGADDYAILADFKRLLAKHCDEYLLRRLHSNKNEVTAIGRMQAVGGGPCSDQPTR